MATISSLPPEIILQIFFASDSRFTEVDQPVWENRYPNSSTPPLLFTRICSRWRAIALDTPLLWSSLALKWDDARAPSSALLCMLWLSRSKEHLLSLSMEEAKSTTKVSNILPVILPLKHLWKHIRLEVYRSTPQLMSDIPQSGEGPVILPHLESLEIEKAGAKHVRWFTSHRYPNLRRLVLGYDFEDPSMGEFPWHQLTHFGFHHPLPMARVFEVLKQCSNLKYLDVTVYSVFEGDQGCVPTSLPLVSEFRFRPLGLTTYYFLDALTLPNLTSFIYFDEDEIPVESVASFLQRSQVSHIELVFNYYIQEESTVELLKAVPRLASLTVRGSHSTTKYYQFGDRVINGIIESAILPELKSLTVKTPLITTEERIMELLVQRDGLKEVYLTLYNASDEFKAFLNERRVGYTILPPEASDD